MHPVTSLFLPTDVSPIGSYFSKRGEATGEDVAEEVGATVEREVI
jgi:hypothetical protein